MVMATWEYIVLFGLGFIFLITSSVVTFVILRRWRWNFSIVVLEDADGSGKWTVTRRDKARLISFGDGGEEIFLLRRMKKYRVGYGKRIGKNYVAFAIAKDGYWYNVGFGDFDKKLMEVGVVPVDRDMRFATASMRKGIENRYNQKTFFEKWGVPITIGMLIIAIIIQSVGLWFVFDKLAETSGSTLEATKVSERVLELAEKVLGRVDSIETGGSGIVPAVTS